MVYKPAAHLCGPFLATFYWAAVRKWRTPELEIGREIVLVQGQQGVRLVLHQQPAT
ncbi:hypothetical protein AGR3A_Lc140247 [Agrobacterium tomkonis CFBP 6623]|uniref:Uncharacterized protein n=1 Tax=Agrobacterium tomkonis CFBP 6623 TaxID=1183432 RepID=A0A1S7RQY3_9HYPH|nr:hypothetical protein AGR3A_Lc140247 [Agrobacterium tomkonis CFBP 6623]